MGLINTKISDICEYLRNITPSQNRNSNYIFTRYTNFSDTTNQNNSPNTPHNKFQNMNTEKFNKMKSLITSSTMSSEENIKLKLTVKEFPLERTFHSDKSRNKFSTLNSRNFNTYPNSIYNFKNNLNVIENEKITKPGVKLQDFKILKVLGRGSFGKVLLVKCKKTQNYFAMKVLKKEKLFKTNQILHTKTEKEVLEKIEHPFLIKLYYAFQNDTKLYLVSEFMQGGELFFHLNKAKTFSENKVRFHACEIILALEYLHKNDIIYRDLKPENILLDVDGRIKLTDFGLSKILNRNMSNVSNAYLDTNHPSDDRTYTICGTPDYLAPEILMGSGYNKSVDWWSLGILIYQMLTGSTPFKYGRERRFHYDFFHTPMDIAGNGSISENAKNLIMSLLKINPSERLNDPRLIKSHEFFKEINWTHVESKKYEPEFVPKKYFRYKEDLCFFDKRYVEHDSISSDEEMPARPYKNNSDGNFFKRYRRYNDFENFSFERKETVDTL